MFGAGFKYRKLHYIQGSSAGAQTNYQIALKVYDGVGTDSGDSVYLNNLARSGIPDIRFTTLNGTALPYWIEHPAYTGYQIVWVLLPTIPVGGTALYILYGNDTCVSASNGVKTFLFFDDFEGSALDASKWTSSGTIVFSNNSIVSVGSQVSDAQGGTIICTSSFPTNTTFRSRASIITADSGTWQLGYYTSQYALLIGSPTDIKPYTNDGSSTVGNDMGGLAAYHIWSISRNGSTSNIFSIDDSGTQTLTTHIPTGSLGLRNVGGGRAAKSVNIDWIIIKKYISPEPAHGAYLPMETSTQPLAKAYDQRGDPQ